MPCTTWFATHLLTSRDTWLTGLRSQKNFIGCLQDIFFNDDDLLELLNFSSEDEKVKYHGDGPAMAGCHDLTISCIQFTHDAAFARVEHSTADSYDLQLTLRTLKSNCILTYTETSAAAERGYIQVGSSVANSFTYLLSLSAFSTHIYLAFKLSDKKYEIKI